MNRTFWTLLVDLVILVILSIPPLTLKYFIDSPKLGFFCDDETISLPYHSSTIPSWLLYSYGIGIPFLFIICTEVYLIKSKSNPTSSTSDLLLHVLQVFMGYLFGVALVFNITDFAKYYKGRLRPHFFDVCRPNWDDIECGNGFPPKYVTNYSCEGNHELFPEESELQKRLKEIYLSFPSGHASHSWQSGVFVVMYLQAKFSSPSNNPGFLLAFFQFLFLLFPFFTAMSRVNDHKHHTSDVLTGALTGTLVQILNTIFVMKLFVRNRPTKDSFHNKEDIGDDDNAIDE